jgi:hypothetical protein
MLKPRPVTGILGAVAARPRTALPPPPNSVPMLCSVGIAAISSSSALYLRSSASNASRLGWVRMNASYVAWRGVGGQRPAGSGLQLGSPPMFVPQQNSAPSSTPLPCASNPTLPTSAPSIPTVTCIHACQDPKPYLQVLCPQELVLVKGCNVVRHLRGDEGGGWGRGVTGPIRKWLICDSAGGAVGRLLALSSRSDSLQLAV